ncbi:M48 family metallopeptidase [Salinisphaera sp. P385]|uniref:M48 family metallopeptidase n=1 Tax=Spectribacter acetivorans TaxID=3075603 RepID=A0ABU3BAP0_9GAMM|nr:M48 family metallopeptidase [Salinisphaera sp. P385]MDT0619525.1 M48 family metallopeptidase [Salinisphaera sp. P385]
MSATDSKSEFKRRVRHWAEKLDVNIVWLGVRPMRNKWASCSTAGHLNFNAELLDVDVEIWDYVIVHELLHFFVPNHGKLWKSLMRAHLGEYEASERDLKRIAHDNALQRTR